MTTKTDTTYNGWTNYETWACALWIDNEQGAQDAYIERAQEVIKHPTYKNEFMKLDRRIVHELAEVFKAECEEAAEQWMGGQASFFADIFNAALSEVNWFEIAEHYIELANEQED